MAVERLIGVDFGTSTSVIRVKRYENGKPIGEKLETKEVIYGGNGSIVPTLVMRKDDDASVCYFGYEAQQKKKNFSNFHSFKMNLESSDPEKRALARKLTEDFYAYLGKQYKNQSEGGHLGSFDDKERTIISYPVKWQEETKAFMLDTAKKAGFPNVIGMDEAQAAIQAVIVMSAEHLQKHGFLKKGVAANILLIDMGAGTTDLVLARYYPDAESKTDVLNTWPKDGNIQFGGREVDSLLQTYFRELLRDEDPDSVEKIFRRVGIDKFKSWKEGTVSPALYKNDSVSDFAALDERMEDEEIELEYCLNRASFEACLADYLRQLPELVKGCLESANMSGSDVDLVIVTGGHSQWYFVKDMLSGKMPQFGDLALTRIQENPDRIIPISRPQETVALGLAYSGISELWETKEPEKTVPEPVAEEMPDPVPVPTMCADQDRTDEGAVPVAEEPSRNFSMRIDSYSVFVTGQGTVVWGVIEEGRINSGDRVYVCGRNNGQQTSDTVKKIEFGNTIVWTAEKGQRVGLLLPALKKYEVITGTHLSGKPDPGIPVADLSGVSNYNVRGSESSGKKILAIPPGKSIEGAVQLVKQFFSARNLETQYFQSGNYHVIQARKQAGGLLKLAGGNRAVEVRMTLTEDGRVMLNVGGGKWADKAGGAFLSAIVLGPLAPVGVVVYGANALDQAKLIENVTRTIETYFSN